MSFTSANIPSASQGWQFEGTTTDRVTGLTGTTTGVISYVSGLYNQAVNINNPTGGTANYISYSLGSSFLPTSFTWTYWIKYGQIPVLNIQAPVYFTDSLASYTQFRVTLNNLRWSGMRPYLYNNSIYLDCPYINPNTWYHFAVVLSSGSGGSTITLYFNSTLIGSFIGNNNQAATLNNMYVGSANTIYGSVCVVDDLRLFNTSLTATQIQNIYSQNANISRISSTYKSDGYTTQIKLSGAPVFSQISAASSSIGAWSLRALNGVTAKVALIDTYGPFPLYNFTSAAAVTGVAVTGQTCTQNFADGTYIARCSTNNGNGGFPQFAFDNNIGTFWEAGGSGSFFYNGTGNYTYSGAQSTTVDGVSVAGDWLQLQSPKSFILTSYSMYGRSGFAYRMSNTFVVAGSNDGTTWNQVDSRTGITTWSGQTPITFTTTSTTAFTYFRLITRTIVGNGTTNQTLDIAQWTLNGRSQQDFYADRLGNLTTVPIIGQSISSWLGGGTGYIRQLYDQTGSNIFSQTTTVNQPAINLTTTPASITFAPSLYLSSLYNFKANPYTLVLSMSAVSAGSNVLTIGTRNWGLYNSTGTTGGLYPGVFSAAEGRSTSATALTASTKTTVAFVSPTPTIYVGGSTVSTTGTFTYSSDQDVVGGNMTLGGGPLTGTFTGQVYECSLFNSSLSVSDILKFG